LKVKPKLIVFTGAGMSAESGIPTFRGSDGLWEGHRVEDVATPEAFERQPDLVHQFYNERRWYRPNPIGTFKSLRKMSITCMSAQAAARYCICTGGLIRPVPWTRAPALLTLRAI
jgi:NAD-dependent SIR2 family protein deacetylase